VLKADDAEVKHNYDHLSSRLWISVAQKITLKLQAHCPQANQFKGELCSFNHRKWMGSRGRAPSRQRQRGSGGVLLALCNFFDFVANIMHF